jgi:hypothetical protein
MPVDNCDLSTPLPIPEGADFIFSVSFCRPTAAGGGFFRGLEADGMAARNA